MKQNTLLYVGVFIFSPTSAEKYATKYVGFAQRKKVKESGS